eukprot:Seg466.2 transcript_id=Seg466.2/GoldUCD/mRNA.D3Y31 product="hypothetical protein" protein_id=Seg466.2/GoldUCD/D3Y31
MADDGNEDSNISGFMNKRGRRSLKWKPVFAKIESNCLVYGQSEDAQTKSITLAGAIIQDESETGKQNHFNIRPKQSKRTYYFSTSSTEEHQKWLQAIFMAKLSDKSKSDNSEACVIQ